MQFNNKVKTKNVYNHIEAEMPKQIYHNRTKWIKSK